MKVQAIVPRPGDWFYLDVKDSDDRVFRYPLDARAPEAVADEAAQMLALLEPGSVGTVYAVSGEAVAEGVAAQ